jgi:hypothetical protein
MILRMILDGCGIFTTIALPLSNASALRLKIPKFLLLIGQILSAYVQAAKNNLRGATDYIFSEKLFSGVENWRHPFRMELAPAPPAMASCVRERLNARRLQPRGATQ